MSHILRELWWVWFVPAGLLILGVIFWSAFWWFLSGAILATALYWLFWWVQFTAIPKLDQTKLLFEKFTYEISTQNILMKLDERRAIPIEWGKIQKVYKRKEDYILVLSKGEFVQLPFKVFKTDLDLKFMESMLLRKKLLPSGNAK